jgi:HSP20 family protein
MPNITVQKSTSTEPQGPAPQRGWDPFRSMRDLMRWDATRWDPFAEIVPRIAFEGQEFLPAFDVKETPEAFLINADMPGIKQEELDVKVTDNRLTIEGKREAEKTEKGEHYYASERSFGSFARSFTLPQGVQADKIEAKLTNGVLSIQIPKKPEAQPKRISVKT